MSTDLTLLSPVTNKQVKVINHNNLFCGLLIGAETLVLKLNESQFGI